MEYKRISGEGACRIVKNGNTIGFSGFTPVGYPKVVPLKLAERKDLRVNVYTGASVGEEIDTALVDMMDLRMPYMTNKVLREAINDGRVRFIDTRIGKFTEELQSGFYPKVDVAIVEACALKDGGFVPTTSVGAVPAFVSQAETVIIELNSEQPESLEGIHDIFLLPAAPRDPIPLKDPRDRIGKPFVSTANKEVFVVETEAKDSSRALAPPAEEHRKIAENLISFFQKEVASGKLPKNLLPLQSGVGNIANAVTEGLKSSGFEHLVFYTEVLQDCILQLLRDNVADFVSATSISLSPQKLERFYGEIDDLRQKLVLRPQDISNCPEIISRLGVISMNGALEADIYGNVNSTHIDGREIVNGLGGSEDFTSNACTSIFFSPSTKKNGAISFIVPMASHVDHTEHDVDVIVTEQGVADLRGKEPEERAKEIIERCAHPAYKEKLYEYLRSCEGGHIRVNRRKADEWYKNLRESGSMLGP
ncbi:MAG: acetyl-CoA hydrolase/transferase C-terminal domain-containing protein [Candidatus Thermoplasmatota archaeon]|nr:acetyl-CoA hydrolase/transferase C-terminal domain-containing protein [Candidatus Thermoplasmatota archaeon]